MQNHQYPLNLMHNCLKIISIIWVNKDLKTFSKISKCRKKILKTFLIFFQTKYLIIYKVSKNSNVLEYLVQNKGPGDLLPNHFSHNHQLCVNYLPVKFVWNIDILKRYLTGSESGKKWQAHTVLTQPFPV